MLAPNHFALLSVNELRIQLYPTIDTISAIMRRNGT